jgi:hypothetical protein
MTFSICVLVVCCAWRLFSRLFAVSILLERASEPNGARASLIDVVLRARCCFAVVAFASWS